MYPIVLVAGEPGQVSAVAGRTVADVGIYHPIDRYSVPPDT